MNEFDMSAIPPADLAQELCRPVLTPLLEPARSPAVADSVRSLYEAIQSADMDRLRAAVTEDAVLHVPGTHALGGDHQGPDGFVGFLAGSWELSGGTEQIELIDVLTGADHAAAYCRIRATRPDRPPLENTTVHVLRMEGGRVAEAWLHNWDDVHVQRFWAA